jgi:fused signal recognition particle receptor
MFDFLKKKLKLFEKNIEAEIESELKREEKAEKKQQIISEPQQQQPTAPTPQTVQEVPPAAPVTTSEPVVSTRKRALRVPKPVSEEKRQREAQLDKQIEQSIESELQRVLETRKSIEQAVGAEKKPAWTIDDSKLDDLLWDLEMGLLEADVAYSVIDSIKKDVKQEIKRVPFDRGKAGELVETVLKNAIGHVLKANNFDFTKFIDERKKPVVIMFVGVNGTGKTLSIAKIAYQLQKEGKSCVMAAGDTFRAGAIEQLTIHADRLGVKIVKHGPGSDPAAVAYDAIEHAKAKHKDVVLLDTAGRMQTNSNLMDEMAKIKRVAKPDFIIFVGDALSGNDAVEQAKRFNEVVGIDGVILTKVDADAKGGSSLSIAYTIGKPLLFIGVGQKYEDQIPFEPDWMIKNIFEK